LARRNLGSFLNEFSHWIIVRFINRHLIDNITKKKAIHIG
jgi:hypothetical protein